MLGRKPREVGWESGSPMTQFQDLQNLAIRPMRANDAAIISEAFVGMGWARKADQYLRYVDEQEGGTRQTWIATVCDEFAGYVTLTWKPNYPGYAEQGIPEIQDLNV